MPALSHCPRRTSWPRMRSRKLGVGNTMQIGGAADDNLHIRKYPPNREAPAGWVFFGKTQTRLSGWLPYFL